MIDKSIADQIVVLRCIFAENPTYLALEGQFHELLDRRRAELAAGVVLEARGIALIGTSGAGKTEAMKRLLKSMPRPANKNIEQNVCEVLSFIVPSPATLKFVGQTGLREIGFPLRRDRTSQIIWDMFKDHLRDRKTLFLHLDEAQHLSSHETQREIQSVIDTLKSLMQNPQWPVGLILSGTPTLKAILNHDPQLARRFYPIKFPALNAIQDTDQILATVSYYVEQAKLMAGNDLLTQDFAARAIHAANGEYGLLIEYTIDAIENALRRQQSVLNVENYRDWFSKKAGCLDGLNPFYAGGFERIDCRKLLGGED